MRRIAISTVVLLTLVSCAAHAGPPFSLADRTRVERMLSAYETTATRGELLKLHPRVDQILLDIVAFPSSRVLARTRAICALALFPTDQTRAALKQVIARCDKQVRRPTRKGAEVSTSLPLLDLQQALSAYARAAGPAAVATVAPYLSYPNRDVRATAALATRLTRSPKARALLLARQKVEPQAMVKVQLGRQLKLLQVTVKP